MRRVWVWGTVLCLSAIVPRGSACVPDEPQIALAFDDLYNFNFPAAHGVLNQYIAAHPQDPLPYAIRASAYLFYELDRLGILESQFLTSDKRIVDKKELKPDQRVRGQFMQAEEDARSRAAAILTAHPNDRRALFALSIVEGVATDYMALVEKHQITSLATMRKSNSYAQELVKMSPPCYDAYMTSGLSEYMVGSLPFFIRWFVHFDNVQGSKEQGVKNLELVVHNGTYFKSFAKILLGIIDLREKKPAETERLLAELAHDYPSNPLFRRELAKLNPHSASAGGQN